MNYNKCSYKGMLFNKITGKLCIILTLILFVSVLMTGCKQSPTLQEVRYTDDASQVDTDISQLDPEEWGQLEEQFQNEKNDESQTDRDETDERGLENEESDSHEDAADISYRPDQVSELNSNESPDGKNNTDGSKENAGMSEGSGTAPEYVSGDPNSGKQIVDASGRTVTVPENVGSVVAAGAAAQMVEMIGGAGKLMAADSELLSSSLAKTAFSDISSVKTWWSGNGNEGISAANFSALLAAKPDVCLEISGSNAFSSSQTSQLTQAGIAYVVLPALTSQKNLENAAMLVGQMFGDACVSKANEYISWIEETISAVSGKAASGITSLYLTGWDDSAQYTLNSSLTILGNTNKGSGLAVAYSPKAAQMVSSFMEAAGVTNESTRDSSSHRDSNYVYVCPQFRTFGAIVSGSEATYYSGEGEYGSQYDLFVARKNKTVYTKLGSSAYPAIIVDSNDIKDKIEKSWFWQYHEVLSDGYIKENVVVSGNTKATNSIEAPYDIYVNPQGMLSWADGSVESPLEAYWVASKFAGTYSINDVKQQTSSFYKKFFGCTLSDSQLTAIFAE